MREVVVHVVPVSRQSEDETTDDPLMCMKGTKGKTGEMSGNALRAVKQVVQKEDQEWCPWRRYGGAGSTGCARKRAKTGGQKGRVEPPKEPAKAERKKSRSGKNAER